MSISDDKAQQTAKVFIEEGFSNIRTLNRIDPSSTKYSKEYQYLKAHRLIKSEKVQARLKEVLEYQ